MKRQLVERERERGEDKKNERNEKITFLSFVVPRENTITRNYAVRRNTTMRSIRTMPMESRYINFFLGIVLGHTLGQTLYAIGSLRYDLIIFWKYISL